MNLRSLSTSNAASLTAREIEVMNCLLDGKTAKETARQLYISFRTVEKHFENIRIKLGCKNKQGLISKIQTEFISAVQI